MDMIRKLFLEKQLAILPADVIGIIREYDGVFRDRFTKTVLKSLNFDVNMFWDKKMIDYANGVETMYSPNYIKKLDDYYYILWNVLITPPVNYGEGGDGLFIVD
jgi:hypothetical protein